MDALTLTGITRSFGAGPHAVHAVRGIDLTVQRGEVVALLGPNGAGKTTLLDIVLGLSSADGGEARVLGLDPRRAASSGRISAVLQTGGLLSNLTVAETVEVIAGFHRAAARIPDVMQRAQLADIAKRKISKCSGGEQQRVRFALALLPDPDVLVLDEPTAGMDVTARHAFWNAMREDADAGRTIIFATHYLEEAEQFARRTVVMNHGRVVADGATAQLRASLGGRTVSATLPTSGTAQSLLSSLRENSTITDLVVDGARVTIRTTHSDLLASTLLTAGCTDLEIAAPTLETAFTALTKA